MIGLCLKNNMGYRKKKGDMFNKRANINRIAYFQADSAMGAAFYNQL